METMGEADGRLAAGRHVDRLLADRHVVDQELDDALIARLVAELVERGVERDLAAEVTNGSEAVSRVTARLAAPGWPTSTTTRAACFASDSNAFLESCRRTIVRRLRAGAREFATCCAANR